MADILSKSVYSTAEVAALFSVTETTIKRWVAGGILRCRTTPGGHRRFDARDVREFALHHDLLPPGVVLQSDGAGLASSLRHHAERGDLAKLERKLLALALKAEGEKLLEFFETVYSSGIPLATLYDDVVQPALATVGARWERGEIDVATEHAATHSVTDAIAAMQSRVRRDPSNGLTALCASAPNDQHDLGLRCAANILEERGWHVHFAGARTPIESLVTAVRSLRPALVCLSFSSVVRRKDGETLLQTLRSSFRNPRPEVLLGGAGAAPEYITRGACDAIFTGTAELNAYVLRKVRGTQSNQPGKRDA